MLKGRSARTLAATALTTVACGIAATSAYAAVVTICNQETVPTASDDGAAGGYRYTPSSHTYYLTYAHNLGGGNRNICAGAGGYTLVCHNNELTNNYGTSKGVTTAYSKNNSAYRTNMNSHADY